MSDYTITDDELTEDEPKAAAPEPRAKRARKPRGISAKDAAKVIEVYERFAALSDDDLLVVSSLLGSDATVREVALASLSAKDAASHVRQILAWHDESSELEMAVLVMDAADDRAAIRPVWTVLVSIGALVGDVPRNRLDITRKLVPALRELSDDSVLQLRRAADLLN